MNIEFPAFVLKRQRLGDELRLFALPNAALASGDIHEAVQMDRVIVKG